MDGIGSEDNSLFRLDHLDTFDPNQWIDYPWVDGKDASTIDSDQNGLVNGWTE